MAIQPNLERNFISIRRRIDTSFFSRVFYSFIVLFLLHNDIMAQAPNGTCATAEVIAVNADCTPVSGDLYNANTSANITGSCANTRRDVWYQFTVPANSTSVTITVTLTSAVTTLTTSNVNMEVFNASTCTLNGTTLGCQTIASPRTYTGLAPNGTYYMRITTSQNTTANPGNWNFNICVTSNDAALQATPLTPGTTRDAHLFAASPDPTAPAGCATGDPDDDVWFRFTAVHNFATITLNNIGANLSTSGAMLQLYSGTPGALTSISCGRGIINQPTGITSGQTYYIRVYSSGTGQGGWTQAGAAFSISVTPSAPVYTASGRMKEIYRQTTLSAPNVLADPWEVTYGPDNKLWITESKGYRLYRMDPVTGNRDTVLDISQNSTFLPVGERPAFNVQFNNGNGAQGGFAGMALHPKFLDPTDPQNYVYVSYVYSSNGGASPDGIFFTNKLVRFNYNPGTGKLESPVALCDTLPGSNDHNSQRMIIVPVGGTPYLFYASGDMGAGQFSNRLRPQKAQFPNSYEGKILRFNLEDDGEGGLNGWIPNANPYNATLGVQSAVWSIGIRNNQGFAYDSTLNKLYGSSHGPYSDDEINIIDSNKNYGHPIVIGYAADGNYNGSTAGADATVSGGVSTCPPITDETGMAATITNYRDPLFSAYAESTAVINNIWTTAPNNGGWPSEGWSGLDLYQHTLVPGWYKSLVASSLKWGRLVRIRVKPAGDSVRAIGSTDTASYFGGRNRYRDIAITAGGKDIYVVMDRSAATSGPSAANPIVPSCGGCVQKYSFVGYADAAGKSTLPVELDITAGVANTVAPATTVTIDTDNSLYWVPITGPDGEIMAEIYANGQTLGAVTAAFYKNTGPIRYKANGTRYLDRNITINAQFPPGAPIKVRFYITKTEYDLLDADGASQINTLTDLKIHRNADPCQAAMVGATTLINPTFSDPFDVKGYVLQADNITSLSSFYFGAGNLTLPLNLLTFTGQYKNGSSNLKWETTSEINTDHFIIERSLPDGNFEAIGKVVAKGSSNQKATYQYADEKIAALGVPFVMYRLKIVDRDDEYTYSHVVTIHVPDILITTINIFPNPANNKTIVSITSPRDQKITWQLIDNAGRTVLSNHGQIRKGNNNITIDLGKVPAGSYFLQVNGQYVNNIQKLQKL